MEAPGRILIVEDDFLIRRLLAEILEGAGYRCTMAGSLDEARAQLEKDQFALVLCDLMLQHESGIPLISHVRRVAPRTKVVIISALNNPALARSTLARGAAGFVVKPFAADELLAQVEAALGHVPVRG